MGTQKLFKAIARSVNLELRLNDWTEGEKEAIATITRAIASDLKDDNIRFKREVFYTACGLTPGGYIKPIPEEGK